MTWTATLSLSSRSEDKAAACCVRNDTRSSTDTHTHTHAHRHTHFSLSALSLSLSFRVTIGFFLHTHLSRKVFSYARRFNVESQQATSDTNFRLKSSVTTHNAEPCRSPVPKGSHVKVKGSNPTK